MAGEVALALKFALALHFGIFEIACLLEVASQAALLLHLGLIEIREKAPLLPHFGHIEMIPEAALDLQLYLIIKKAALALHLSLTLGREPQ